MINERLHFHTMEEAEAEMKRRLEEVKDLASLYNQIFFGRITPRYILRDDGVMIKVYNVSISWS